jgi:hypothetical protein
LKILSKYAKNAYFSSNLIQRKKELQILQLPAQEFFSSLIVGLPCCLLDKGYLPKNKKANDCALLCF